MITVITINISKIFYTFTNQRFLFILFRFSFPFGRPEGALKATLSLLERVLAKDLSTPISREDIRYFIRKCLENAAYTNYTRVSDQAKLEGIRSFPQISLM